MNPDELELKLQEQAKLTSELDNLTKQVAEKQGADTGLNEALAAKQRAMAAIQEDIRKAKAELESTKQKDQSEFSRVRAEHLQEAISILVAKHPELSDQAKLQSVLSRFNAKDDSGKFESDKIAQDLEMAFYNANPTELFKILNEREQQQKAIAEAQRRAAGGAGTYVPPDGGARLTPQEEQIANEAQLKDPNFMLKMRGKDSITGGMLSGKEKTVE